MRRLAVVVAAVLGGAACLGHGAGSGSAGAGAAGVAGVVLWDLAWMEQVKAGLARGETAHASALARLRREADEALRAGPFSVMDKKLVPPSGDKHDYMSVGPYWWPDPSKPDGLPYIRRDGVRNPARNSSDTDNAAESAMAAAVETLGLAHFFTGHAPYAAHAVKLLRVWFLDAATRMNPHLTFAQAVPGLNAGRSTGVIDTVDMIGMLESVELLVRARALPAEDELGLRIWFGRYVDWLQESEIGQGEQRATNNHGSWYDTQVSRFALFAGRAPLARSIAAAAPTARIATQIEPDGRQPRELARSRSFHYSGFNLAALFSLAGMSASAGLGTDLYGFASPDGRSLRRALDFLLPYLDPAAPWGYRQLGDREPGVLVPVLRRARKAFPDRRYETLATQHLGDHRVQLVLP